MPNLNTHQKHLFSLVGLFILILALALEVSLIGEKQETRKEAAGTGIVKLTFEPSSGTKNRGDSFTVAIKMTATQTKQVRVGQVSLSFNPAVFTVSALNCGSSLSQAAEKTISGNLIRLACFVTAGDPAVTLSANTAVILGNYQAAVKSDAPAGSTVISFAETVVPDTQDPKPDLADAGTSAAFTIDVPGASPTPSPTPSASPTPTPTASPQPTPGQKMVNLLVKFRGVNSQPGSGSAQTANFKVRIDQQEAVFSATVSGQGVWTIKTTGWSFTAGSHDLFVKGPKHLQKKFGSIALTNTQEQTVDLTAKAELKPGDLPVGPNNQQDGVVNAFDAVSLVSCLATPQSQICLAKADLNLDAIVSTIDIELLNSTINSQNWEDEN